MKLDSPMLYHGGDSVYSMDMSVEAIRDPVALHQVDEFLTDKLTENGREVKINYDGKLLVAGKLF